MSRLVHLSLLVLLSLPLPAQEKGGKAPSKAKAGGQATSKASAARKPSHPSLRPIQDQPGLPRVLLIGDSISMGYTIPVRNLLDGVANVHRIPANGGPTSRGVENIDRWLGRGRWDVIHFNWGIHDLKIMENGKAQVGPKDYEKNLRTLVEKMQATGATLVFATTTPIPEGKLEPDRKFGEVAEYNRIAQTLMFELDIPINNLNEWITPRFREFHKPNDLHFTPDGYAFLAEKVARDIEEALYD